MNKRKLHLISILAGGLVFTLINWTNAFNVAATTAKQPNGPSPNGAALYGSNCAICHGRNGSGTPAWRAKGQPDLSTAEWQKTHSDDQIAERIRLGKGKMPSFGKKFSEEDVTALVKQVRSFRK
jgi:mono/diheme cytochrome c family protein